MHGCSMLTSGDSLRKAILEVMRELSKNSKMIHKQNVYSMLQNKTDSDSFERELNRLQDDGEICQSHDVNHFLLVE